MKVLHILNELKPSGAEVMLELAAPVWRELGCSLHVTAFADTPGPFADRLTLAGWNVSNVSPSGPLHIWMNRLFSHIRAINPDVIHLHQEGRSFPILLAAKATGIPVARTIHNNFPFTGMLRFRKLVERWASRLLGAHFISISPSVSETELRLFRNPTKLYWNWFQSDGFRTPEPTEKTTARRKLGIPEDLKILVSIGNGSNVKNYRLVVEALAAIKDPKIHYYQVGNSHPENIDALQAKGLKIEDRIHFAGPSRDIQEWLWAADVYVMPSTYEGFGLAAVEALASGCDCIFSDCQGLNDFKSEGVSAKWVSPLTNLFTNAILDSVNDPLAIDKRQHNSSTIRNMFNTTTRCRAYYELWKEILTARI